MLAIAPEPAVGAEADALSALVNLGYAPSDGAEAIARVDQQVGAEYEIILRQLMTYMMEDARSITGVLDVMWAARALERIGDHAKNIGEYVIFLVKGKDVRHTSLDSMEAEVLD